MRYLQSATLAALFALTAVGVSGQLASANAEPASAPAAKAYAYNGGLNGSGMGPVQAGDQNSLRPDVWSNAAPSRPVGACDLRCRTGFFGYK